MTQQSETTDGESDGEQHDVEDESELDDYSVQLALPFILTQVGDPVDAAEGTLSATKKKLAKEDADHIDAQISGTRCSGCGQARVNSLTSAGMGLIEIVFESIVYNAESQEQAVEAFETDLRDTIDMPEDDKPCEVKYAVKIEDVDDVDDVGEDNNS